MADKTKSPANPATLKADNDALRARIEALELRLAAVTDTAPREDQVQKLRDWTLLSTQEKNQLEADRLYGEGGGEVYEVSFDLIQPIKIRARSREEAEIRFLKLCGITGYQKPAAPPAIRRLDEPAPEAVDLSGRNEPLASLAAAA